MVNIRRIFDAAGDRTHMTNFGGNNPTVSFTTLHNQDYRGTFADIGFGRKVCEDFGLSELAQQLGRLQTPKERDTYPYIEASFPNRYENYTGMYGVIKW